MGIKNLKTLLDKHPSSCKQVPLKTFQGKRIAIDAGNVLIRSITSVWSTEVNRTKYPYESPNMERFMNNWLSVLRRDVERFLINGVTPVYVFDGEPPEEKRKCREKRSTKRQADQDLYNKYMQDIQTMPANQVPNEIIYKLKVVARRLFPYSLSGDNENESIDMKNIMRSLYLSIGVPVLDCKEESERLCANLCLEGYCSAVFTNDRDTLTHGAPIIIDEFSGSVRNDRNIEVDGVNIIILHEILFGLQLSFPSFVDLCIMLGCDYNTNIGNIGAIKSYEFIKQFGQIENIPLENIRKFFRTHLKRHPEDEVYLENPVQLLNHHSCRRLFARKPVMDMIEGPIPLLNINKDCLAQTAPGFLSMFKIQNWISTLVTLYTFVTPLDEKDNHSILPPTLHRSQNSKLTLLIKPKLAITY